MIELKFKVGLGLCDFIVDVFFGGFVIFGDGDFVFVLEGRYLLNIK